MGGSTEDRIDALYRLPPEEFIAARAELARALRLAGEKETAKEVAGLRRPTVAAWALDQLRDRDPDGVEQLESVGAALREAQERALAGDPDADLRGAAADRRALVVRLTKEATAALRAIGREPAQHVDSIAAVLETAVVSNEVHAQLRAGRLTAERVATDARTGDAIVDQFAAGLGADPRPRPTTATRERPGPTAKPKPKLDRAGRAKQRRALDAARAATDAADEALRVAEADANRAARTVDTVKRRVDRLEGQIREARQELDASRAAAKDAKAAVSAAQRRRNEAQRALRPLLDADDT